MKLKTRIVGIVKREGEFLLVKKNSGRMESAPLWELPMGKMRQGEQPEESMARIIFDSVGATIDHVRLKDAITFMSVTAGEQVSKLYVVYDVQMKTGEKLATGGGYSGYKFVRLDDPRMMASMMVDPEAMQIIEIELGRMARPIFDGVTNNMLGNNFSTATVYVDGGSRGNPGPSGVGYHIVGNDGTVIKSGGEFIGFATSRMAEYYALKEGCEQAIGLGIKSVRFVSDSLMMVNQMNGLYKVKNMDVLRVYEEIRGLLKSFDTVAFVHVKRELNAEADRQANIAIDKHFDV